MQNPFIYKIQTDNGQYIYDVNTNAIVRCTKIAFNILPEIYKINPVEISERYGYQIDDVLAAEKEINALVASKGVFSCKHPQKMQFDWDNAQEVLNTEVSYLRLDVTEQCNQRCSYCYFSGNYKKLRTHGQKMMSRSTAHDAVDFLFQHSSKSSTVRISFYGGEPLLNFRTIKATVEYAKHCFKTRVSFDILTNGSLLDDEIVKFLVGNDFWVTLSLDGPSEIHDRNRVGTDGGGTFARVWKKLNDLYQYHPKYFKEKVTIRCTIAPPTTIQQMVDFFDLGFLAEQEVVFSIVSDVANLQEGETRKWLFQLTQDSYLNLYSRLLSKKPDVFRYMPRSLSRPLKDIVKRKFTLLGDVVHPNRQCLPGAKWPTITTEGKIIICDAIGNNPDMAIGDVADGWNMKTIISVIDRYIDVSQACLTCWLIRFCPFCLPSALNEKGYISHSAKETKCAAIKKEYGLALYEYIKLLETDKSIFDSIRDRDAK